MIAKVEQVINDAPLAKTPDVAHEHLEGDTSMSLIILGINHHKIIIGCLNWIVTLGRMDIACAESSLDYFHAGRQEGHLTRVLSVAGCLKKCPNLELVSDSKEIHQTKNVRAVKRKELMERHPDVA